MNQSERFKKLVGWICPICGNVYAPWVLECEDCNVAEAKQRRAEHGTGRPDWIQAKPDRPIAFPKDDILDTLPPELHQQIIQQANNPVQMIQLDPNTQCVDCDYGVPTTTPDGLQKSIRCRVFNEMRTIMDTCKTNTVDIRQMTTTKEE